ncbi:hypothetical protein QBC35DRAFT_469359 [Podospora australis]|uniref:Uncharacterized protein n=1 Tax=Podospora australis TaxID=1536484 RepID=A0AAN6X382_9PEZI|nr:hypothetical protein QBC35DRAFT_469359 [Podospora australis]
MSAILRSSLRTAPLRPIQAQLTRTIGRRSYASAPGQAARNDMPWIIGSVGVTVPGIFLLWPSGKSPNPAGHGAHETHEEEHIVTKAENQEVQQSTDNIQDADDTGKPGEEKASTPSAAAGYDGQSTEMDDSPENLLYHNLARISGAICVFYVSVMVWNLTACKPEARKHQDTTNHPERSDEPGQSWLSGLFDFSGEGGDCPRSCCIGCDQFGRTEQRLNRLVSGEDPLDLTDYKGCNRNCWNYFLLCIFTVGIGSGVYTAKQTREIRQTYGIKGKYGDDVVKGIFCQPCSLIRNGLEVRRRTRDRANIELLQAPLPLGEQTYHPLFTMSTNDAYRAEPQMSTSHTHPNEDRAIPLYPQEQLPEIPHVASPLQLNDLARRAHMLTPITETDSLEDFRNRESIPNFPQTQAWIQSTLPDKICPEECPEEPPKKDKGKKMKKGKVTESLQVRPKNAVCQTCGGKKKVVVLPVEEPPAQIFLTAVDLQPVLEPEPEWFPEPQKTAEPPIRVLRRAQPLRDSISVDEQVPQSSGEARTHNIRIDIQVPGPVTVTTDNHTIEFDQTVAATDPSSLDPRVSADKRMSVRDMPIRDHNLESDEIVIEAPESDPEVEDEGRTLQEDIEVLQVASPVDDSPINDSPVNHSPVNHSPVNHSPANHSPANHSPVSKHALEMDRPVSAPVTTTREHNLSSDARVPTPTSKAYAHGIHLDERVPTPELVRLNAEHGIFQDRKVLTPSPQYDEHDIHADGRVPSPALFPPKEYPIHVDKRVDGNSKQVNKHGIQAGDRVPSPAAPNLEDYSISTATQKAQRAQQLLGHLIEQDRKAWEGSNRSRPSTPK